VWLITYGLNFEVSEEGSGSSKRHKPKHALACYEWEGNMINEQSVQTLMKLGLSSSQSKTYLSLTKLGEATVITVSKSSNIDRGETYRVLSKLMDLGLVEKIIDSPNRYRPVSLAEALSILLDRKKQEDSLIKKETERLLEESSSVDVGEPFEKEEPRTLLIPSGKHLANLMRERLTNLQRNYDGISYVDEFERRLNVYYEDYKRLLDKGVKIRFVLENPEDKQLSSNLLDSLNACSNFEVSFVRSKVPACIGIYDDQEVQVSTARRIDLCAASAYWTNSPVFVALARCYFDSLWTKTVNMQLMGHP
jgi:sugar-specific transcriptional regulator TrmB